MIIKKQGGKKIKKIRIGRRLERIKEIEIEKQYKKEQNKIGCYRKKLKKEERRE